jgi:hypothetical protein
MTLPDLVTHFFPSVHLSSCRQVLQDVLGLDLYRGNRYVYYLCYCGFVPISVVVLSFQLYSSLFVILCMISQEILNSFYLLFDPQFKDICLCIFLLYILVF